MTELEKAARMALEAISDLKGYRPDIDESITALTQALATTGPAQAGGVDTGPRVLREVFALCEDTMDKMTSEGTEFSRGRAFEAKGISRAIGAWFQDEFCGRSYMGEPAAAERKGGPVAWMWQHEETGRTGFVEADQLAMGWTASNPRLKVVAPLYTSPQVTEDHPLMVFAIECEMGALQEHEVPLRARKAIDSARKGEKS